MEVSKNILKKVMQMAHLELKPEEEVFNRKNLNSMVEWIKILLEVNTKDVDPLLSLSNEINILESDENIELPLSQKRALYNVDSAIEPYFSVQKKEGIAEDITQK